MYFCLTIAQKIIRSTIAEFGTSAPIEAIQCYRQAQIQLVMSEETKTQSVGEARVRTTFNPSQTDLVAQIKQKSAELINLCEELKAKDGRLASLAQTAYEEAAMWAVKAATA